MDGTVATDARETPTASFQETADAFAGDGFHPAVSTIRRVPESGISQISTDRQPSTVSYKLLNNSSNVSPCIAQPGMAGTTAQYPPSSASWTTTFNFMVLSSWWVHRALGQPIPIERRRSHLVSGAERSNFSMSGRLRNSSYRLCTWLRWHTMLPPMSTIPGTPNATCTFHRSHVHKRFPHFAGSTHNSVETIRTASHSLLNGVALKSWSRLRILDNGTVPWLVIISKPLMHVAPVARVCREKLTPTGPFGRFSINMLIKPEPSA